VIYIANYFSLSLDTTAPASPTISLEGGAAFATDQLITATIGCGDGDTTGYQMILWGDVDTTHNANIQATEGASSWITYSISQQVKLSTTDGSKTVYLKIRDDVYNESSQTSDSIILDATLPVVSITGPDVSKISKQTGKNTVSFSFQCDSIFDEYKVKVVATSGAAHDTGTQIPTTAGSSNMSGSAGDYPASTPINCQIKGTDLETASSGDGLKIVKVFVKDQSGQWSV
jgi:hypothetical protein